MPVQVIRSSTVPASPSEVWAAVSTLHGVNAELGPFVTMREPDGLRGRTLESFRPDERAVCWMLAGGLVPFDRHHLGLESVTPGRGFVEESTSWLQRRWRHERTLEPVGEGTRITDRVTAEPRLGFSAPVVGAVVGRLFDHRHRVLVRRFGAGAPVEVPDVVDPTVHTGGGEAARMVEQDLGFVERAPARAEATRIIDAPAERVWQVLVDHRRWPEWFGPSLVECRPTSTTESGVGSSRVVKLRGGTRIAERFIAWEQPRLWAFTATASRPKVFEALVERAVLEPLTGDRTRITYTMAFAPAPALRWAAPLLQRGIGRSLARSLQGLANRATDPVSEPASGEVADRVELPG